MCFTAQVLVSLGKSSVCAQRVCAPAVPGFGALTLPAGRLPCPHGLAALCVLTSTERPALTFPARRSHFSVSLRGVDVFWSRVAGQQRPGKSPAVLAAAASLLGCFPLAPARLTATRSRASCFLPPSERTCTEQPKAAQSCGTRAAPTRAPAAAIWTPARAAVAWEARTAGSLRSLVGLCLAVAGLGPGSRSARAAVQPVSLRQPGKRHRRGRAGG